MNGQQHRNKSNVYLVSPNDLYSKPISNPIIKFPYFDRTFHQSMRIFLSVLQACALMPIYGISAPSPDLLRYSFFSFRNLYSVLIILACLAHGCLILAWNITTGYTSNKLFPLIWTTVNPLMMFQFIIVARKWRHLMQQWVEIETVIISRNSTIHRRMHRISFCVSVGLPTLAAIEHLLSLGNNVNTASLCKMTTDTMSAYFSGAFSGYFYFFKVNYFSGVSMQLLNFYCTCAWSLPDIFIMLVSLGLVTEFKHFNEHLESFKGKHVPSEFWTRQRYNFTKLTQLLDQVNKDLGFLILISFASNTFYICLQLYHIIEPSDSAIRRIYLWYSLIYLMGKMFLVTMVTSLVNDESTKPIKILETIPADSFESEAARFMQQLTTVTVALGGMQLFYVTRTFLVRMVGTIFTYEIILIQVQKQPDSGYDPCTGI